MDRKEKILIISAFPPNRMTAGQNFTKNFIERISKYYHVDIVYFNYPGHQLEIECIDNVSFVELNVSKLFSLLFMFLGLIFFINPLFAKRFDIRYCFLIRNLIKKNNYKFVIFNYSQVFIYSLCLLRFDNICRIFIIHDVIYQLFQRVNSFGGYILSILAFLTEKILFRINYKRGAHFFTFSKKDKNLILNNYGITCREIHFYLDENVLNTEIKELENSVCLYGAWNRKENLEILMFFFQKIYFDLKKAKPDVIIYIVGSGIEKNLTIIPSDTNIKILGFIDNPYEIISKSKLLFAPLFHGAGVKVKVIEALATGTPVIGTDITFEGIEFDEGIILINPDNVKEILEKIIYLLDNVDTKYKIYLRERFLKIYYNEELFLDKILNFISCGGN